MKRSSRYNKQIRKPKRKNYLDSTNKCQNAIHDESKIQSFQELNYIFLKNLGVQTIVVSLIENKPELREILYHYFSASKKNNKIYKHNFRVLLFIYNLKTL